MVRSSLEIRETPSLLWPCSLFEEESPSLIRRQESGSSSGEKWLSLILKEEDSSPQHSRDKKATALFSKQRHSPSPVKEKRVGLSSREMKERSLLLREESGSLLFRERGEKPIRLFVLEEEELYPFRRRERPCPNARRLVSTSEGDRKLPPLKDKRKALSSLRTKRVALSSLEI